jgi:iron complex outermembrane receptor protein
VVYELGDPSLKPETSLEEDLAFGLHTGDIQFELDVFNNNIHDFIYAKSLQSVSGGDSINNSLNAAGLGEAPVYKYTQGKARLYGGELSVTVHPSMIPWLSFNSGVSVVYGSLLNTPDSVKYLPFVPPARITAELKFLIPPPGHQLKNIYIKAGILDCFRQDKIYLQSAIYNGLSTAVTPYEYAASRAATEGYALFNAGLGGDVLSRGRTALQVFVQCDNLFNTAYMDYMSRFKYYPVNYTTGRVGVFNMGRNVSVRILIPLGVN